MAQISYNNWSITTKLLDPTKNKIGEKIKQVDYPSGGQCCFCGETKTADLGGYVCGLWIDPDGDFYSITHVCKKGSQTLQEEHSVVKSSHKCHCPIITLLREGCVCNGV